MAGLKQETMTDHEAQPGTGEEDIEKSRKAEVAPIKLYRGPVTYCKNHGPATIRFGGEKKCPFTGCDQKAFVTLDFPTELEAFNRVVLGHTFGKDLVSLIKLFEHSVNWSNSVAFQLLIEFAVAPATLVEASCLLSSSASWKFPPNNERKKFNFGLQTASKVKSNLRFEIYGSFCTSWYMTPSLVWLFRPRFIHWQKTQPLGSS